MRSGQHRASLIHALFTRPARAELCLTGLWLVATLVSEAVSAGFADVVSTAIPAHFEAKGNSLTGDLQRVRRMWRTPSGPGGIPSGKDAGSSSECPGFATVRKPKRSKLRRSLRNCSHAARQEPDFPRMAHLAGDCPLRPMRGLLPERRGGRWGRRRIRSCLLWLTPNIPNKPRANL